MLNYPAVLQKIVVFGLSELSFVGCILKYVYFEGDEHQRFISFVSLKNLGIS